MGSGIALHLANCGLQVALLDRLPEDDQVNRNLLAQQGIRAALKQRGSFSKKIHQTITLGNFEDSLSLISKADWVIEVIVEDIGIKRHFYQMISPFLRNDTIISSNTSGISINDMKNFLPEACRKHFIGTHFFNPVRYMSLVELIPSTVTSGLFLLKMKDFFEKTLGKNVILAKDTPNFIANRVGVFASACALALGEKNGLDFSLIDAMTGSFIGRSTAGVCKTGDIVGLDVFKLVCNSVASALTEDEKVLFELPKYMNRMIKAGNLGRKTGSGFFAFDRQTKITTMWSPEKMDYVAIDKQSPKWLEELPEHSTPAENILASKRSGTLEGDFVWEAVRGLLIYASEMIPEVTEDFRKIDLALKWGYNYQLGPFELWDALGGKDLAEEMLEDGILLPDWVMEHLESNDGLFYAQEGFAGLIPKHLTLDNPAHRVHLKNEDATLYNIGDDVAVLEFHTKGNVLKKSLVKTITEWTGTISRHYKGLVIYNEGKQFCSGADLNEIFELAQSKNYEELEARIRAFQEMNQKIKYLGIPVVAAVNGIAFGGGMEMCMHATKVLADSEAYMGLVEAGVGVVPAGGGLKELAIHIAGHQENGFDDFGILTTLWQTVAYGKISGSGLEAVDLGYLPEEKLVLNINPLFRLQKAKHLVLSLMENYRPPIEKDHTVLGETGFAQLQMQVNTMLEGRWISPHDGLIALKMARVLTGGELSKGMKLTEKDLLELEVRAFIDLVKEKATLERIGHMLKTGKPLRN